MIEVGDIGLWASGIDATERAARCRELRALALVYLGLRHPLTQALTMAVSDAGAAEQARVELSALPALTRRRLLASYGALLLPHVGNQRRPRGGDPNPAERAARDQAACDLARLVGADLSLEQQAARIIARAERYRPMAGDDHGDRGGAERAALHRLTRSGLPIPGRRQLRRILAKQKAKKTALDGHAAPPPADR